MSLDVIIPPETITTIHALNIVTPATSLLLPFSFIYLCIGDKNA